MMTKEIVRELVRELERQFVGAGVEATTPKRGISIAVGAIGGTASRAPGPAGSGPLTSRSRRSPARGFG
jgi:hypothetical protein